MYILQTAKKKTVFELDGSSNYYVGINFFKVVRKFIL